MISTVIDQFTYYLRLIALRFCMYMGLSKHLEFFVLHFVFESIFILFRLYYKFIVQQLFRYFHVILILSESFLSIYYFILLKYIFNLLIFV